MQNVTIEVVEEILEEKISKNPNRFESANGIMFSTNEMKEPMTDYFNARGIEYHELVSGVFYTETIMSLAEFSQMDHVMWTKQLA